MSETGGRGETPAKDALAGQPKDQLMEQAVELDPNADELEVEEGTPYLGDVYNVVDYGVFVQLTEDWGSDIVGLVHQSELPALTAPRDYNPGDRMVVELAARNQNGDWAFSGLYSPDVDASGLTLDDVREVFLDLQDHVDALTERVAELETESEPDPDPDGEPADATLADGGGVEPAAIPHGMDELASVITHLDREGYDTESLATESRESGDVVEVNAILKQSETGTSDD